MEWIKIEDVKKYHIGEFVLGHVKDVKTYNTHYAYGILDKINEGKYRIEDINDGTCCDDIDCYVTQEELNKTLPI
jgi:hypothetical protein